MLGNGNKFVNTTEEDISSFDQFAYPKVFRLTTFTASSYMKLEKVKIKTNRYDLKHSKILKIRVISMRYQLLIPVRIFPIEYIELKKCRYKHIKHNYLGV